MMTLLTEQLQLDRCPHCQVDRPSLYRQSSFQTSNHLATNTRWWKTYACVRCGGVVLASASRDGGQIGAMYPRPSHANPAIPDVAREYLQQAIDSLHAPAGSVILCASAVDAMLKVRGYRKGTLNGRIDEAAANHLITADMAEWAHQVRLDANDPRHADEVNPLPSDDDAKRSVEFVLALGEFLFVLPSKVKRGLERSDEDPNEDEQPDVADSAD